MENYEVIVIGSGPAGNTAAYALKEQGKKLPSLSLICGEELVRTADAIQRKC